MAAAPTLQTTVDPLAESRVRVGVRVAPEQIDAELQRAARRIGRQLKLPGFRKGKVPAGLALQRVGRQAVLDEAVREGLPGWYAEAIRSAGIVPVGDPKLDLGELPGPGGAFEFSFEIGVLPQAELGEYRGLEVPRRQPAAAEEQIEREIAAIRERLARLQSVTRAAEEGDFVVVDYVGRLPAAEGPDAAAMVPFAGGEGRDQLIELAPGTLLPGFAEGLTGAAAGETRSVAVTFPEDYSNAQLAGREAVFEITVKDVKDKQLPEVDDDFATDAGFEDVGELREDIRGRLLEADERQVEDEFREAALDAAADSARVTVPPELARARATEMWERMLRSLAQRGVSREAYTRLSGRAEPQVVEQMLPDAERALRREALLTAVVAAEGISPSDEDLLEALIPTAEREETEPAQLLAKLRESGRLEEAREDLAARQAVDLIADQAKPIALERAQAREKLWTPDKADKDQPPERERAGATAGPGESPGGLWTPGR